MGHVVILHIVPLTHINNVEHGVLTGEATVSVSQHWMMGEGEGVIWGGGRGNFCSTSVET